MKSKDRHKHAQNELAKLITNTHQRLSPYYSAIVWSVVLILAIYVGFTYWTSSTMEAENRLWTAVNTAITQNDPAIINAVLEDFPEGHLAAVGRVNAGDLYLRNGTYQLFENKAEAANELEKAIDSYETALKIGMTDENLHERAIFGLARAYEAVAGTRAGQGQLDQAVEQYEKLVEQWPNGIYISIAKERLTALKTTSEKEFYDIFAATQDQTAPTSPGMGLDPEDLREVPEGPDEDLMESAGLSFDLEEPEQDDQNEGAPATNGEDTETTDSQLSDAPAAPPEIGTSDDVPASDNDSAETATPSPPEEEKEKNENDAAETSPQPAEQ